MLAWTKSVIAEAFCFIVYYVEFTECLAELRVALREDVVARHMEMHATINKQQIRLLCDHFINTNANLCSYEQS